MTHRSDQRPDTPMISAVATRCRLTYGNRARGFHQGQSAQLLANRPVIVTQSFLCSSALQIRGSPYSLSSAAGAGFPPTVGWSAVLGCSVIHASVFRLQPNKTPTTFALVQGLNRDSAIVDHDSGTQACHKRMCDLPCCWASISTAHPRSEIGQKR